jgi:hypothetical protein
MNDDGWFGFLGPQILIQGIELFNSSQILHFTIKKTSTSVSRVTKSRPLSSFIALTASSQNLGLSCGKNQASKSLVLSRSRFALTYMHHPSSSLFIIHQNTKA